MVRYLFILLIALLIPCGSMAAPPPSPAVKFVISNPDDGVINTPVTITVRALKTNNKVDADYQDDVTLVTSGSATGGGLVDIVNGVGAIEINDSVAETVVLSLLDTEGTGLDVSSTQDVVFYAVPIIAWEQTDYWFRDDDGDDENATGFGASDVNKNNSITSVTGGTNFRLRFGIKANDDDGAISNQIEFKEGTGCATGAWTPISSTSDIFSLRLSPYFNDGDVASNIITTGQYTAGRLFEFTNPAPPLSLNQNIFTEYEWSLTAGEDIPLDTTYTFRISNNGSALDTYTECPILTSQYTTPPETNVVWVQESYWFRDDDGGET